MSFILKNSEQSNEILWVGGEQFILISLYGFRPQWNNNSSNAEIIKDLIFLCGGNLLKKVLLVNALQLQKSWQNGKLKCLIFSSMS